MSARPRATSVVEHEVRVVARPETVFAYFTDPVRMVQWMGVEATLDPRPGGICRLAFRPSPPVIEFLATELLELEDVPNPPERGLSLVMSGEFVEVEPPERVVLTWGWEEERLAVPPQSTLVEVTLTPDGDETVVRLAHRRLPIERAAFHRAGWDHYLPRLGIAAARGDAGPDPWQADLSAD